MTAQAITMHGLKLSGTEPDFRCEEIAQLRCYLHLNRKVPDPLSNFRCIKHKINMVTVSVVYILLHIKIKMLREKTRQKSQNWPVQKKNELYPAVYCFKQPTRLLQIVFRHVSLPASVVCQCLPLPCVSICLDACSFILITAMGSALIALASCEQPLD